MKYHSFVLAALCTSVVVEATTSHNARNVNHKRLTRRADGKKCRARTAPATPQQPAQPATPEQPAQLVNTEQTNSNNNNSNSNSNNNNDQKQDNNNNGQQQQNSDNNNQQAQQQQQQNQNTSNNSNQGASGNTSPGLLNIASNCGDIGASDSEPNGSIGWLNCGIENEGWRPQNVQIGDLKVVDLRQALNDGSSPFHACSNDIVDKFYQYGGEFGVPAIVVASIAMQESTCNPNTTGGGGEAGLMQITHDKCGGAPGGNCYDVDYNIRTGVKYFKDTLDSNGGNALKTFGNYNGWREGMNIGDATAAAHSACCRCQNNLDYLYQMVNGWLQNKSPYANKMGKYFNLDVC